MKLHEIYTAIIKSTGKEIDDDQRVVTVNPNGGAKVPAMIALDGNKLPLRIPTREVLSERDQDAFIGFHPLSESHVRGESAVNTWLRRAITYHVTTVFASLIDVLAQVSIAPDVKSSADPDLLPLLVATKGADEKTVKSIGNICDKIDNRQNVLCNIYIKREGKIKDSHGEEVTYERACIVRFPVPMDDLSQVFGVKLRVGKVKDLEILRDIMHVILPKWDTDAYCAGSNAKETPYFKSLLFAYAGIAEKLNDCINRHSSVIEDYEELLIDTSWVEHIGNLSSMMDDIVSLPGNIGATKGKKEIAQARRPLNIEEAPVVESQEQAEQAPQAPANPYHTPAPTPTSAAPYNNQQSYNPPAPSASSAGGATASSMMAARSTASAPPTAPQYQQPQQNGYAPQYQQPPQQNGYAPQYQQQAAPQGGYYAPQPQQGSYYAPQAQPELTAREQYQAQKHAASQYNAPAYQQSQGGGYGGRRY